MHHAYAKLEASKLLAATATVTHYSYCLCLPLASQLPAFAKQYLTAEYYI